MIYNLIFTILLSPLSHANDGVDFLKLKSEKKNMVAESLIANSEEAATKQLLRLIKKKRGTEIESDLYLRLAELYIRRSKTGLFFEMTSTPRGFTLLNRRMVKGSRFYIKKALKTYQTIRRRFPRFHAMDQVLFYQAFAFQKINEKEKAKATFLTLINKYPRSPHLTDSYMAVGEILFSRQKYKKALTYYHEVERRPQTSITPFALYKIAWSYYNLRNTKKGMGYLEQIIVNKYESKFQLREEALKDMAIFYGEIYPAQRAYDYFAQFTNTDELAQQLILLGKIYNKHSRFKEIDIFLQDFIDKQPDHLKRPTVQYDLVLNQLAQNKSVRSLEEMERLSDYCFTKNPPEKDNLPICSAKAPDKLLSLSKKWWKNWTRSKKERFYKLSRESFRIYFQYNPKHPEFGPAKLASASLFFEKKLYYKASEEYRQAAKILKDEKRQHQARYAAIVSFEKSEKNTDKKHLLVLLDDYLAHHLKGKYFTSIQFKKAHTHYVLKEYPEAKKTLSQFFKHKKVKVALREKGEDIYLDILNLEKDFKSVKESAQSFIKKSKKKKRQALLKKILIQSDYAWVQGLESQPDKSQVITEYQRFIDAYPKTPLIPEASLSLIRIFYKEKKNISGADAAMTFSKKYPKHRFTKDALIAAAHHYEEAGLISKSLRALQLLKRVDKQNSNQWSELIAEKHSILRKELKALKIYQALTKKQSGKKLAETYEKIRLIYKKRKKHDEERKIWKKLIQLNIAPYAQQAWLYQLQLLFEEKKWGPTFKGASKLLRRKSGASLETKVGARLLQAKILQREFISQSVKSHVERTSIVLTLKVEKLQRAQSAYQYIIKYGNPEQQLIALQSLNTTYQHFIEALSSFPRPREASDADYNELKKVTAELVQPIKEELKTSQSQVAQRKRDTLNFSKPLRAPSSVLPSLQEVSL